MVYIYSMASYTAPTENLPIFDPSVFINDLTPITIAEGDKRYLRFPFAQGTEYLTDIYVGGVATFSGPVAFNDATLPTTAGTLPAFNDSSTKMPTTAWVQTAISGAIPTSLLGLNNSWTGTNDFLNTGTGSLTSSATQPATNDNSTKIPTTSWVQSLIATLPLPSSLLGLNNTWTGTQNWTSATEGSLTSSATQPATNDSSTKIPTTAWVQSAIGAVGSILGLNNTFTGFNVFGNTNEGSLTSLATQPAYNDSSTKIPTTAWIQGLLGQFLNPITIQTSTAQQIYPPTALHLYATGYIIGKGGLAGDPATPDFGPWGMGGAGGGAGGVSFSFQLQNNIQYVYFGLNYTSAGYSSLSVNSTSPSGANTMAIANVGGNGADSAVGGGGGTGGSGTFTSLSVSGLISSSGSVSNGTNGTAGTSGQTGSTLVFPTGGSNALNLSYGFGQSHPELDGYNTSGYINYPASPIGDPRCVITWTVSPP